MNVNVRRSIIHGYGVFAKDSIEKSDWEYVEGIFVPVPSAYGFEVEGGGWWEPSPPFRYTNHSNDPNCVVYDLVNGRTVIEAMRKIHKSEELTIDYGFDPTEK